MRASPPSRSRAHSSSCGRVARPARGQQSPLRHNQSWLIHVASRVRVAQSAQQESARSGPLANRHTSARCRRFRPSSTQQQQQQQQRQQRLPRERERPFRRRRPPRACPLRLPAWASATVRSRRAHASAPKPIRTRFRRSVGPRILCPFGAGCPRRRSSNASCHLARLAAQPAACRSRQPAAPRSSSTRHPPARSCCRLVKRARPSASDRRSRSRRRAPCTRGFSLACWRSRRSRCARCTCDEGAHSCSH